MKIHLLTLFLFILALFHTTLSCLFRSTYVEPSYISNKKFEDPIFVKQASRMEECIAQLPKHIYRRIARFKNRWAQNAFDIVLRTKSVKDQQKLHKFGFLECFEIVAEHNANRFICKGYFIDPGELDMLAKYALEEYYQCVDIKNDRLLRAIEFQLPRIGIADILNDIQ
ncbi:hypothetical protein COBT_000853 [Conglomerata obtusa]